MMDAEQGTRFLHDLGDAARRNPVSTALIGMGLAWMFSGRASGAASEVFRRTRLDQLPDAAADAFDSAALPITELEAEYLGETSDAVKDRAQEFASEQTARVMDVAESAVTAVTDEAARQGLTIDGAKSVAGELSAKVGRVVDAAGKGIPQRAG